MIKLWDKKSPINGKDAEEILNRRNDLENAEEILLIGENERNIRGIEIVEVLRGNLGLSQDLTALEVGEAYLNFIDKLNKGSELEEQTKNNILKELAETKLENIQLKNTSEQIIKELSDTKLKMMELENKVSTLGGN